MHRIILTFSALVLIGSLLAGSTTLAQPAADRFAKENELAQQVLAAHGGEKFRSMSSLVVRGSVDITASNFPQAIAGGFVTIYGGEKYRFELQNPFQNFTQAFDGTKTTSTVPGGFSLPPVNRLGLPLLPFLGKTGFIVTSLPEEKKKRHGFRMTTPEGYVTDFFVNKKSNQLTGYDATFTMDGRTISTNVEIDKMKMVDGITVPERYAQRFDLGAMTVYVSFKAKEIVVNSQLDPEVFSVAGK